MYRLRLIFSLDNIVKQIAAMKNHFDIYTVKLYNIGRLQTEWILE